MSKGALFKVTILNWEKHNPELKAGHTHFLLSKRIFNDAKIAQLTPSQFQMFMYLLTISADMVSDSFEISVESVPKYFRINVKSMQNCLKTLEQFQLLTAEKKTSFINRIEKKGIEENRSKENTPPPSEKKIKHPAQDFEIRFTSEYQAISQKFEEFQITSPRAKNAILAFAKNYQGNIQGFDALVSSITSSKRFSEIQDNDDARRYLAKALLSEAGV